MDNSFNNGSISGNISTIPDQQQQIRKNTNPMLGIFDQDKDSVINPCEAANVMYMADSNNDCNISYGEAYNFNDFLNRVDVGTFDSKDQGDINFVKEVMVNYENLPERDKNLFSANGSKIVLEESDGGVAHYSPKDNNLYMAQNLTRKDGTQVHLFQKNSGEPTNIEEIKTHASMNEIMTHEVGHYIDRNIGKSKNPDFIKAYAKDAEALQQNWGQLSPLERVQMLNFLPEGFMGDPSELIKSYSYSIPVNAPQGIKTLAFFNALEESYAEGYDYVNKDGQDSGQRRDLFAKYFPNTITYMSNSLYEDESYYHNPFNQVEE